MNKTEQYLLPFCMRLVRAYKKEKENVSLWGDLSKFEAQLAFLTFVVFLFIVLLCFCATHTSS